MTGEEKLAQAMPNDYAMWSWELVKSKRKWEVLIPLEGMAKESGLPYRRVTFRPDEYDTAEDEYAAVCDLVNGCRASETAYYVFCDDRLVLNFWREACV